jgi:amidophosphoribosyltransferase
MDTGRLSELLAADLSVGEICDYVGADSLAYIDLDRLITATRTSASAFCTACLSGEYPVAVPVALLDSKLVLERTPAAQELTSSPFAR